MNILFFTLIKINDIEERGIYTDLLREFAKHGHQIYIARPAERRFKEQTSLSEIDDSTTLLKIKTLNFQETNLIEKGIATLMLEWQFLNATKKYFSNVKFDLLLYSTPPITFSNVVAYFKKRDHAQSYLLLKDIFPQNAVDLGMIRKNGIIHRYFKRKEKQLYEVSDFIGCMSPANVNFLIDHQPQLDAKIIEVNPNSISPTKHHITDDEKNKIRIKYHIPIDQTVFIYGGNLGKPQGISFLQDVLKRELNKKGSFFLIVGAGTEYKALNQWFTHNKPTNALLIKGLPKEDYDQLLSACDVGLIFLDRRFTIPNFPSRLLSYMEFKMPVLAATDKSTDLGKIIEDHNFGFWAESGDVKLFESHVAKLLDSNLRKKMGDAAESFLMKNYLVNHSYSKIIRRLTSV